MPPVLRTWTGWDYATYWMSDLINATTWQIASSAMLVGLSTADAIAIAALAAILNSLPTGKTCLSASRAGVLGDKRAADTVWLTYEVQCSVDGRAQITTSGFPSAFERLTDTTSHTSAFCLELYLGRCGSE